MGVMGLSFHHAHRAAPTFQVRATSWLTVSSAMGDGIDAEHDQASVNQAEQQHEGAGDGRGADARCAGITGLHLFFVCHHAPLLVSVTVMPLSASSTAEVTALVMSAGFAPMLFARVSSAAVCAFS